MALPLRNLPVIMILLTFLIPIRARNIMPMFLWSALRDWRLIRYAILVTVLRMSNAFLKSQDFMCLLARDQLV